MLSIISFSDRGEMLATKLCKKYHHAKAYRKVPDLQQWAKEQFEAHHEILFIGACGIAVRTIAPWIESKLTDSPVLVMDEAGQYVIPILAGHVGGANRLAGELATFMGAVAVITTATDVNEKFAVDVFATENGLAVQNKEGIQEISSRILRGEVVSLAVDGLDKGQCGEYLVQKLGKCPEEVEPVGAQQADNPVDIWISDKPYPTAVLWLKPREVVVGMGCKKGKSFEELFAFVKAKLADCGVTEKELFAISSIDVKKEEVGLQTLADFYRVPFCTYSSDALMAFEGEFTRSDFVMETVAVDNVCERAALAAAGGMGEFILRKVAENGMTMALVRRDWRA